MTQEKRERWEQRRSRWKLVVEIATVIGALNIAQSYWDKKQNEHDADVKMRDHANYAVYAIDSEIKPELHRHDSTLYQHDARLAHIERRDTARAVSATKRDELVQYIQH